MKNFKRILVTLVAAVLLMAVSVGGTLAWLQSQTGTVKNTFEIGNVTITLDEGLVYQPSQKGAPVDPDDPDSALIADADLGQHVDNGTTRTQQNANKLMPSKTYDKDPKIYIDANSEDCWLFVKVVNGISAIEADTNTIASQMTTNGWTLVSGTTDVYSYKEIVSANDVIPVFATFTLAADANIADYVTADNEDAVITIQAYAIQAEEIGSIADAWTAAGATWPTLGN